MSTWVFSFLPRHSPCSSSLQSQVGSSSNHLLPPRPTIPRGHLLLRPQPDFSHVALLILARRLEVSVLGGALVLRLEVSDDGEADENDESGAEDAELECLAVSEILARTLGRTRTKMTRPSATAMLGCCFGWRLDVQAKVKRSLRKKSRRFRSLFFPVFDLQLSADVRRSDAAGRSSVGRRELENDVT